MPISDGEQGHRPPLAWPGDDPRQPQASSSYRYLLDIDDDLAQEFDLRMRVVARQVATVVVADVPVGAQDASTWLDATQRGFGVLVIDGVLAVDTLVGDRVASELVGPGDLLQNHAAGIDDILERRTEWRTLVPSRLALLDAGFAERVRPWPQIGNALLRRAGRRADDLNLQRAIACQPRLEVRLTLLLWHLAARWGRVEPGGIRVPLPLTHRLLGRLVGAERPSVSHALTRLSHAGLVTGHADEWHLHGTLDDHLAALADRSDERGGARPAAAALDPPSREERR
jgi:CRP/FNR family transcriptional regulator, cyclic AMP receptor protein